MPHVSAEITITPSYHMLGDLSIILYSQKQTTFLQVLQGSLLGEPGVVMLSSYFSSSRKQMRCVPIAKLLILIHFHTTITSSLSVVILGVEIVDKHKD